jgi:hypothetical protein
MHKDEQKLDWKDIIDTNVDQTHNHSRQSLISSRLNHCIC